MPVSTQHILVWNGLAFDTQRHSLLMGMRTTAQSHRQPVQLFKGSTNVFPQLYQSHHRAVGFITDQKEDCKGRGRLWPWVIDKKSLSAIMIYSIGEPLEKKKSIISISRGQRDVSTSFSELHKREEGRSEGWETEELLLDCGSIWIFAVLPEERL